MVHKVQPAGHIQIVVRPAMAKRKVTVSQHLHGINLQVQGEIQLGYHLANHILAFNTQYVGNSE